MSYAALPIEATKSIMAKCAIIADNTESINQVLCALALGSASLAHEEASTQTSHQTRHSTRIR